MRRSFLEHLVSKTTAIEEDGDDKTLVQFAFALWRCFTCLILPLLPLTSHQEEQSSAHTAPWSDKFIIRKYCKFESLIHWVIFFGLFFFFSVLNNAEGMIENKLVLYIVRSMWEGGGETPSGNG